MKVRGTSMASDTDISFDKSQQRYEKSEKTCDICSNNVRKSCIKCASKNCNIVMHIKCFEIVTRIFTVERINWRCRNCVKASSVESQSGLIGREFLLQKELNIYNMKKNYLMI